LFAVAHVGQFLAMDRSNLVTMMVNPAFRLSSAAFAITFPLILIALVALYWREAQEAGLFGAVAFCIAVTGTVALAGDMWFEGFASHGSRGSLRRCSARIGPEAPWSRRGWSPWCC
jgi:Na+(H+)/acetate symporter ActP